MTILFENIKKLVQTEDAPIRWRAGKEMQHLPCIENAYLIIEGDTIVDYGRMEDFKVGMLGDNTVEIVDVSGRMIFPAFCDSHSHIVYAGSREIEYIDKIKGLSYEEIAQKTGLSPLNIRVQVSLARKKLKQRL